MEPSTQLSQNTSSHLATKTNQRIDVYKISDNVWEMKEYLDKRLVNIDFPTQHIKCSKPSLNMKSNSNKNAQQTHIHKKS